MDAADAAIVRTAVDTMARRLDLWPAVVEGGGDRRRRDAAHLADIHEVHEAIAAAERALHDLAVQAHEDGVTWALIAQAVGCTRQNAQHRFTRPAPGRMI